MKRKCYEPNYEGSPVIAGPPGGKSSAHGTHTFTARAGHHLPQQPLSSGKNVFEVPGAGFTLLAFDVHDADVAAFERAAAAAMLPLDVVRDGTRAGARRMSAGSCSCVPISTLPGPATQHRRMYRRCSPR